VFLTLDHVQIAAPDGCESTAREFYGALLGLAELERPTALQNQGGLWFACGALQVHIGVDPDFRPARKAHVAFRVEDLDSLQARFRVAGCEIVEDSLLPGVRRFFSYDPWGNRLEFVETTPRPQGDVA
jgi:catechol 2,3-dioxygenase-like lactoylglutathione lyase family enzyme